ncbi:phosphohistidine phosphatase, SixA [Desulfatibacillum aliphaticivorans]|uniref:Phosphohistidine phosphatase, SixA n=1 Tax=Desulfatibacillum aliphaticivorans TaxID=218208 RepID=B8FKY3_DESAL|nr:phosphohistidine phosphatase SixA [Desulfatibacillum aliphaticivorans]ACL04505.1 phosphohistidine phosphatase, SixA [Desulfatibacillum aliphaticivorans]
MAVYLVQHGKSLPKDQDPDQGLAPLGIEESERIAGVAAGYGVKVLQIRHSGKTRALQTAEIFAKAFNPPDGVQETAGLKPMDDVAAFAPMLEDNPGLMIVGHLPFMERMASYLITGNPDRPVFRFQNAGIVCLDKHPDAGTWVVKWALMPNVG